MEFWFYGNFSKIGIQDFLKSLILIIKFMNNPKRKWPENAAK